MFGLNKLADKDFIIGFVLPVLVAVLALSGLFHDKLPSTDTIAKFADQKSFASLTVVVLAVWTGAIILMTLNRPLYRLLEGYTGPLALECWRKRMRERREDWRKKNNELFDAGAFDKLDPSTPKEDLARQEYALSQSKFLNTYPEASLVMPTRFGNVVRAFENYPNAVYGLDGIAGWPRLVGVLPSAYISIISDARAEVDFWVNCCGLAIAFGLLSLARIAVDVASAGLKISALNLDDFWFFVYAAFFLAASIVSYNFAVARAANWGSFVKAAFDLYLPALATQLGYELPRTQKGAGGREQFWDELTAMFLVRAPFASENWKLATTSADGKGGEETHAAEPVAEPSEDPEPSNGKDEPSTGASVSEDSSEGPAIEDGDATAAGNRNSESPIST